MTRFMLNIAVILVCVPQTMAEGKHATVVYALPADGTWVEYQWTFTNASGKEQRGLLHISSVGRAILGGAKHRWLELRKQWRDNGKVHRHVRKILVRETGVQQGGLSARHVAKGHEQRNDGVMRKLSDEQIQALVGFGLEGTALQPATKKVTLECNLGKLTTRHTVARRTIGQRTLEYQGWLTKEIPFGWARFEIYRQAGNRQRQRIFQAVVHRAGSNKGFGSP